MRVAQALYEDGLITYMRTDGVDMAPEAISAARRAIANRYDAGFVPDRPRQYQSKIKNAQEAHEAIRPTDFDRPRAASGDHARLYELVYNRALASQMASARLERTTVELTDGAGGRCFAPRARSCSSPAISRSTRKAATRRPRTRKARACRRCARATRRQDRRRGNAIASPSRRRAIPKRAWSSGSRSSGSAARRPTPRRCRRSRTANMSASTRPASCPRRAGGW